MPLARSRYRGGIGAIGQTFSPTATPTCPPGQHYVAPAASSVRGIGACVPNTVIPLTLHPTPPPSPPPLPPAQKVIPLTLPGGGGMPTVTAAPAPAAPDVTAAPAPPPTTLCPPLWPWWWIVVAGAVGFGAGYYYEQNKKKVRRNVGAVGGRIVNRAADVAVARLLG